LPKFHDRMIELFNEYDDRRESGKLEPDVIEFDDDARTEWIVVSNRIEADLQPLHYLNDFGILRRR
jgi:hypothetical protein